MDPPAERARLGKRPVRMVIWILGTLGFAWALFASAILITGIYYSLDKGLSKLGADLLVIPKESLVNLKSALLPYGNLVAQTIQRAPPQLSQEFIGLLSHRQSTRTNQHFTATAKRVDDVHTSRLVTITRNGQNFSRLRLQLIVGNCDPARPGNPVETNDMNRIGVVGIQFQIDWYTELEFTHQTTLEFSTTNRTSIVSGCAGERK